jgi:histidine triad (HIT) family protein
MGGSDKEDIYMSKDDCIFCKIANGEIPSATVYEDSTCRVILDVNPANKGHALIIPKEHFDDIYSMDAETAAKIFTIATEVAKAQKAELNPDGLNILQNNGPVAGQTVFHFHMHLVPRYVEDNVTMTWTPGKAETEELTTLSKALRKRI